MPETRPISPEQKITRDAGLDAIRAAAIVMVVIIHCSGSYLLFDESMGHAWWSAVVLNCLSRAGVPWFFMLTGTLLLCPTKSALVGDFYRKRLPRIMVPLVFWTCAYLAWIRYFRHDVRATSEYLKSVLEGGIYYHLWFLYALAGLYLAIPYLSRMLERLTCKDAALFLTIWFGGASLLPWAEWMIGFKAAIPLGWFGSYFGYLVLGALLRSVYLRRSAMVKCSVALFLVCAGTIAGTFILSFRDVGRINENLLLCLAPNIIIGSTLSFALLRNLFRSGEEGAAKSYARRITYFLSKASLGIYLGHLMVLEIAVHIIFLDLQWTGLSALIILIVACLLVTSMLVWLGLRIPFFRWVLS